ncbi:amino acid permease [Methanonatronarchaeum sp. AMET6-2]|uniref:amino acid permease n=1 Tax=Methanonatronarchaeum sp. AMET6-2 TaxID=2933293 RepID=UPI001FF68A9E|nr:amino acid permease [Methanonatronarchaeum sp. AMET6-2]UOY09496.1 amino acid permease [Methanonatronarchaeum sp. AMET6-2]
MAERELARDLGFLDAYTLGLGTMIGAGIFVLPGIVAEIAGPASMVSFTIGGFVALLAALSLSELATGMPKAGGSYYYVNHALGSFFGTIVGWGMWAGLMFATAFYMLGFGQYLTNQPSDAFVVIVAALIMSALLIGINYRGVKETASLQNFIVVALVGLIIIFIVFGLLNLNLGLLRPFTAEGGWPAVGATAGTVFVAFIGFEVIATSAEEIRKPGRNLPLSMIAAVLTPTVLYVLVMLVSTGILPIPELAASDVPVATVAEESTAFLGVLDIFGFEIRSSSIGYIAMIIGAILATISSANASVLSAARVNFAMGRDKILTNWLNKIHGSFRTPYRAILITGLVILALIASPLPIDTLADVASFMFLITYALVHIAVIVLRRAEPDNYKPDFLIPSKLYPAVPILGFITAFGVIFQMNWEVQLIGLGILALGAAWYFVYSKDKAISTTLIGDAIAPSSEPKEDVYRVVVPVSNPNTQKRLIKLAAKSAARHKNPELIVVNVIEVPPQTSPAQVELEEERVQHQQELLENALEFAEELDVGLRTRALVGRSVSKAVLSVIREEKADEVIVGWKGRRKRREYVLGSTIDPIVSEASCEVCLVTWGKKETGDIVVLVGDGPHTPTAIKKAFDFYETKENTTITLLNVRKKQQDVEIDIDELTELGREHVKDMVKKTGIEEMPDYEIEIKLAENVRKKLYSVSENYDTVVIGATRESSIKQTVFGSLPESLAERMTNNVAMVRGKKKTNLSIRAAIKKRFNL